MEHGAHPDAETTLGRPKASFHGTVPSVHLLAPIRSK